MTDHKHIAEPTARVRAAFERTVTDRPLVGPDHPDRLARLENAVASLRSIDREVFLAHRLDGLTYAEIAARTGRTERDIEKRIARAIGEIDRHMTGRPVRRWRIWPFD